MNTQYIKNDRLGRITLEYMAQAKNLFVDIWEKSFGFLASYRGREVLLNIKIISIIICLVFGGLIIFLMLKMNAKGRMQRAALLEKDSTAKTNNKKIIKRWGKIESKLISDSVENHKLAVLEADDLFEEIFKILGSVAGIRITNIDEIQEVKKIKNSIIDNSDFELTKEEAAKIIKTYKKGLMDLGVI